MRYIRMIHKLRYKEIDSDIVLLDRKTMFFVKRRKGVKYIGLNHHYDTKTKQSYLKKRFLETTTTVGFRKVDALVAVSQYWGKIFKRIGAKKVYVIYNAFDVDKLSKVSVGDFKQRYGLDAIKPIIYIGINTPEKGAVAVYEQLKNLNYQLVTSGRGNSEIGSIHLNLPYEDYLRLLKASTLAVNMSIMPEGWSRAAHEAMLMRTPVIGSGSAGMEELLLGGNQVLCKDIDQLPSIVKKMLSSPEELECRAADGYEFASKFTQQRFDEAWKNLILEISCS